MSTFSFAIGEKRLLRYSLNPEMPALQTMRQMYTRENSGKQLPGLGSTSCDVKANVKKLIPDYYSDTSEVHSDREQTQPPRF